MSERRVPRGPDAVGDEDEEDELPCGDEKDTGPDPDRGGIVIGAEPEKEPEPDGDERCSPHGSERGQRCAYGESCEPAVRGVGHRDERITVASGIVREPRGPRDRRVAEVFDGCGGRC